MLLAALVRVFNSDYRVRQLLIQFVFVVPAHYVLYITYHYPLTRFGEISPLRQKFASLWQIFGSLFLIWQNHTLAIFLYYWANFDYCTWPNSEKQFNNLVTPTTLKQKSFIILVQDALRLSGSNLHNNQKLIRDLFHRMVTLEQKIRHLEISNEIVILTFQFDF